MQTMQCLVTKLWSVLVEMVIIDTEHSIGYVRDAFCGPVRCPGGGMVGDN